MVMDAFQTKRQIFYFLALTFTFSFALQFYVIFNGGMENFGTGVLIGLMWIPGTISLIMRLIYKDWSDIGHKIKNKKTILYAFFVPMFASLISCYICHLLDIRIFKMISGAPISKIALQVVFGLGIGFIAALGEELGWRGFLIPKIYNTNIKLPTLVVGGIWALWHIPIVAFTGYYQTLSPLYVIVLYSLSVLGLNYFICWLRMESGSMWIATLAHTAYNFFFQLFWAYTLFKTPGENAHLWEYMGGDIGLFPIITSLIIFMIGYFKFEWKFNNN